MIRARASMKAVRQRSSIVVTPAFGLIITASILIEPTVDRYLAAALLAYDLVGRFTIRDRGNDIRDHENGRSL
ncbi:hypothetical protein [Actinoplanes sp. NPDC051411]|uniref:hypothetical protein n=1 Tax=Actinoplanes sp. NPDC051411 TaxID=3155522 RepID=UPI0034299072